MSINCAAFISYTETDEYHINGKYLESDINDQDFFASVSLPDNSTITGVVVYGTSTGSWDLYKAELNSAPGLTRGIASGTMNSIDAPITTQNAEVDNENYSYGIEINLDNGEKVYGAKIYYTTRD